MDFGTAFVICFVTVCVCCTISEYINRNKPKATHCMRCERQIANAAINAEMESHPVECNCPECR